MSTKPASPYAHIACCVDGSAAARDALDEAVRLRATGPGRLSVVHVAAPPAVVGYDRAAAEPELFVHAAREWLDALVADLPDAKPVLLWGHPATSVEQWARANGCNLLVAAAHTGPVARAVLGSFSRHLASHAPCPTLLTRPRPPGAIAAAVDDTGKLFADGAHGYTPDAAWTPEHLLLAAIARRALASLTRAAVGAGRQVGGRATAGADLGGHRAAPSLESVRVSLDVDVTPPPEPAALMAMIAASERDTNWAIPLARPVRFAWRVNGDRIESR